MRFAGFAFFAIICCVWASDNWFPHSTHLGVEYIMNCSLNVSTANDQINWYLPNGELIKSGDKYVLDGRLLRIKDVSAEDTGVYTCTVDEMDEMSRQRHTLNMAGPMYYTMTDKYYWNIVVGVVAGIAAALLIIFLVLIYHYRYRSPKSSRLQNYDDDSDYMMYNTKL